MFPLLNLPFVTIRQALQSMSSWEIYQLSLCSVKVRNWIISTGVRKEIDCKMMLHKSVTFNFNDAQKIKYKVESGEFRLKIQEMQELFDFRHHELEVERKKSLDGNDKNGFEWSYQNLVVCLPTDNIPQENAQLLFTNPNIQKLKICSCYNSFSPTFYTGAVIIPQLILRHDHLSFDAILNMETTRFWAPNSKMNAWDINRLLKTWKEGVKLKELKYFDLTSRNRFKPRDVERMIRGLEAEKEEKYERIFCYMKRDTDGQVATLTYYLELVDVVIR